MPKALFIGRFQPFHNGHLDALKQISENEIIIGIGSSQYSGTDENPYSFAERKEMIEKTLAMLSEAPKAKSKHLFNKVKDPSSRLNIGTQDDYKKYKIIAIPDIQDPPNWVEHVKNLVPNFDVVYTGNDFVAKLFQEKNYSVKPIFINKKISGTEIRQMIKEKNSTWKNLVPQEIVELL